MVYSCLSTGFNDKKHCDFLDWKSDKFQLVDMFPQTSNGQKPVDMFLANLKTVDMFLEA